MHYLIDGYNWLFHPGMPQTSLQEDRTHLIELIRSKIRSSTLQCTVVFDAPFTETECQRSHYHGLDIVFTAQGQTADEWILEEIELFKAPRQLTLVTSDKALAWRARQKRVHTLSVEAFVRLLESRSSGVKKKNLKKKEPPPPIEQAKIVPEGSLEHYQKLFEDRVKTLEKEKPPQPIYKKKKSSKIKQTPAEDPVSDMERWQKLFEKRLEMFDGE